MYVYTYEYTQSRILEQSGAACNHVEPCGAAACSALSVKAGPLSGPSVTVLWQSKSVQMSMTSYDAVCLINFCTSCRHKHPRLTSYCD